MRTSFNHDKLAILTNTHSTNARTRTHRLEVERAILLEVLDLDPLAVQKHLDPRRDAGHVVHALLEQRRESRPRPLRSRKTRKTDRKPRKNLTIRKFGVGGTRPEAYLNLKKMVGSHLNLFSKI